MGHCAATQSRPGRVLPILNLLFAVSLIAQYITDRLPHTLSFCQDRRTLTKIRCWGSPTVMKMRRSPSISFKPCCPSRPCKARDEAYRKSSTTYAAPAAALCACPKSAAMPASRRSVDERAGRTWPSAYVSIPSPSCTSTSTSASRIAAAFSSNWASWALGARFSLRNADAIASASTATGNALSSSAILVFSPRYKCCENIALTADGVVSNRATSLTKSSFGGR
mmetsp:Transcript_41397/g.68863  ORF Transcript_41397/g.68863 Transcript_41397/m.68863 type:complete len:224 (-) Transcript_41397:711-1382(-)